MVLSVLERRMKRRPTADEAAETIRARIRELRKVHLSYRQYQRYRVKERDWHGAWDVAVNLSETEMEMAGLRFALRAMGER